MGKMEQRLAFPLVHVDLFLPVDVGTFLSGVNIVGARVNDLVIGGGAKIFFSGDSTEAEGH